MLYAKWIIGSAQLEDTDQHLSLTRFNYYQFHAMANMPDEIVLARMMTALDLGFERTLHYHDKEYESDNDYGLPPHITRPVHIYSVFSAEASFNLAYYTTAQSQLSPFILRCPRGLPFWKGVHQHLTFDETPLPALAADSEDKEEDLPMAELDDTMWDEEPVPDRREYLCIHEIPRPATPPPQPNQGLPYTPSQQPNQVEVSPEFELIKLDIPADIPLLIDLSKDKLSDFEAWTPDVLSYQF